MRRLDTFRLPLLAVAAAACLTSTVRAQCPADDTYEDNDVCGTFSIAPTGLTTGLVLHGAANITGLDDDFWVIQGVPTGQQLTVDALFSHAGGDIDITIYDDAACSIYLDGSASVSDNEQAVAANGSGAAKDYYLQVHAYGSAFDCNGYDLQITIAPDPCQQVGLDDSLEENDSFLAATPLGTIGGDVLVNNMAEGNLLTIDVKGDRDYYSFTPADSGVFRLNLDATDTQGDLIQYHLYEFDPTAFSEEIAHPRTNGITSPVVVNPGASSSSTYFVTAGNTYYIEILSNESTNQGFTAKSFFFGTTRSYTLDLDVPGTGGSSFGGGGGSGSGSGGSGSGSGGGGSMGGQGRGSQPGPPSAIIEPITPDPRSTGVPEAKITFTEDVINVGIEDFRLTLDGVNVDLAGRQVIGVTPSDYTLDLSGITQLAGEYKLRILVSDITDIDDEALTSNANDIWTVTNDLTSFDDVPDAEPGDGAAGTDDGTATLRAAIQESNAVPGLDTIILPAGTYTLTRDGHFEDLAFVGDLNITEDLNIIGAGAATTVIDAGGLDRIFHVFPNINVSISGVSIINGEAHDGGAILNEGNLTLEDVNIGNSRAFNQGGGIYNSGDLYIEDSSIVMNSAGSRGGGVFNVGTINAVNLTVSTNTSVSRGGGIFNENSVTLTNATIAANSSGARGGGLASETEEAANRASVRTSIGNTLIATNESDFLDRSTGDVEAGDIDGVLTSRGHNLVGYLNSEIDRIPAGFRSSDLLGGTSDGNPTIDPRLAGLVAANHTNGTFRHNLKSGSQAIDAGSDDLFPANIDQTDQIDQPRILDGDLDATRRIDIGAKERFLNRPVAFFTISSNPAAINEVVRFNGESSSHANPDNFEVVLWEWDFDYDGTTFDVDATGEIVDRTFPTAGTFDVALRVTDNNSPGKTDIEVQSLEIGVTPGAPVLTRPFRVTSDSTPTIKWQSGAGVFELRVREILGDGSNPVVLEVTNISEPEYTLRAAEALEPGEYTIEVRAGNAAGFGPWTNPRPVRVKEILLRTPRAQEFDITPELRWTGVAGSNRFELFIIDRVSGAEVYRISNLPGDENRHTLPNALPVGKYLYRVTAYDQDDLPGDKSAPRRFDIVTPIPQEPGPVTIDRTPQLVWSDVKAPFYEVEIEDTATQTIVFTQNGIVGQSVTVNALPDGFYRYRVRTVKELGEVGHWSPWQDFEVNPAHDFEQLAPIGPIADRTPLFDWTGVSGVRRYEFRIARQRSDARYATFFRDNNLTTSEFQLADIDRLNAGAYRWYVRAISLDGDRTPWAETDFSIATPTIFAPATPQELNTRFPTIQWNGFSIADTYELRVDNLTVNRSNVIRERGITETEFTPDLPLADGDFRARVRFTDVDGNLSDWGPWFFFTLDLGIGEGPEVLSPTSGVFAPRNPTFVWREVPSATSYDLLIKEVRSSGQPIIIEVNNIPPGQTGNGIVSHALVQTLPGGRSFRWWVRGVNANDEAGPYSAPGFFRTFNTSAGDLGESGDAPDLSAPIELPEVISPEIIDTETVVLATLSEEITVHSALPGDGVVETTTANLKAVQKPRVELPSPAVAPEVDSVMSEWVGNDWWTKQPATEEAELPVEPEDDADAAPSEIDERLALAAALPFIFGRGKRRNRKRSDRK